VRVQFVHLKFIVHGAISDMVLLGVLQMADRSTGIGKDNTIR